MEFSFTLKIKAKKEDAWEYYANIEKWYDWEKDLKNITLKGEFKTGSCGTMELEGMPPMEYKLTLVKPFRIFKPRFFKCPSIYIYSKKLLGKIR